MLALNIMRKTRYDEVTAYCWTGSTDEFRGNVPILVSFALKILFPYLFNKIVHVHVPILNLLHLVKIFLVFITCSIIIIIITLFNIFS